MSNTERTVSGIPQMGYGTWNRPGDAAFNGVIWALEAGYRHIDTAQGYDNEQEVGRAIRTSGVARDDIWLTTKVKPENFANDVFMPSVDESLDKLQMDSVDLLLLHWPSVRDQYPLEDYVGHLAECLDSGRARHIGVSNFTIALIDRTVELLGDRPLSTNQCEIHVYFQNRPIVDHCRGMGISMTAYSPLARGRVAGDPVLEEIAARHNATATQIALAFLMAEGHIVIPSSGSKDRIAANFAARDITLGPAELDRLRGLDKGMRLIDGDWCPQWDV